MLVLSSLYAGVFTASMNLFTIKAITRAPMGQVLHTAAPYVLLLIVGMTLVTIWPQMAVWLPGTMLNLR